MTQRNNILQELNELNSSLAQMPASNVYVVPAGYFDSLSLIVLNRIKAMEAANSTDELNFLSPALAKLSNQNLYAVPPGYFDNLAEKTLQSIRESQDHQNSAEEIESISPLLSSLRKQNPYTVPQDYFESVAKKPQETKAKIVSITNRKWFRYAAAAMIIGVIVGVFLFINSRNNIDPGKDPERYVAKVVKKYPKQSESFVQLVDVINEKTPDVVSQPESTPEINELMKDVSDKEIQEFIEEATVLTEPVDVVAPEIIMN